MKRSQRTEADAPLATRPAGSTDAYAVGANDRALLFEIAWEVCCRVGGIYTVLRSKAPATVQRWADAYFLLGPYREDSARIELEPLAPPALVGGVLDELSETGLHGHFGRWLITGRPQVVLFDIGSARPRLAEIKYSLWKDNGISSPDGDHEFDENVLFGHVVTEFLLRLQQRVAPRPLQAHFHEWQGAAALPMLRHRQARFPTVFTTHATLVGRALSAANADLYGDLHHINAGAVSVSHGFAHRHALEGAAAQAADVFTTVSGITALEAERFLGRRADVLLPNGLNIERFAAPHEFQVLHQANKHRIEEFVMGHFFPSYTFDLDRTLYVFTAGRYEYRNKGLDVFIDALGQLNQRMIMEGSPATVVAFIVTRAPHKGPNMLTLNRQAMFTELRETCETIKEDMGRRLFHTVAHGQLPQIDDLMDEYGSVRLKRMMYAWRSGPPPTIVTHDLVDDAHDPVLCHLRHRRLLNAADDRVKVVFYPEFMSATSPLLAMEYDDFVRGCHMGVFPSYYEPWGYTPLECVVSGVPAVTSDLSGFGDYVMQHLANHDEHGIHVCRRRDVDFHYSVAQLTEWLLQLTRMTRRERIALRNRVEAQADHFDWRNLGRAYVEARRIAFAKYYPGRDLVPFDENVDEPLSNGSGRRVRRSARRGRVPKGAGLLREGQR